MAITPPGFFVDAPQTLRVPRYGLLSTIEPVFIEDPHAWAGGVEWEQDLCTVVESYVTNCPPATGHVRDAERDLEFCHADPFVAKAGFKCATVGLTIAESIPIAKKRLLAWESHEVEKVFWTGMSANGPVNPSLTSGNEYCEIEVINLSPEGALDVVQAVAYMEEALTDIVPGGGIIHAPYGLASYLKWMHLVDDQEGLCCSPTGFPVVLGAGYSGSAPGNIQSEPGTTWIYGTGPVGVWRGDVFTNPDEAAQGLDIYRNEVTVFAERFYAVGFSCALYAVPVQL